MVLAAGLIGSVATLAGLGAADMVSVYIRETLIQLWTPDRVRGRVNAVNMVFIGASNELGEFRAGTSAAWFGVVPAALIAGLGALAIIAWVGVTEAGTAAALVAWGPAAG